MLKIKSFSRLKILCLILLSFISLAQAAPKLITLTKNNKQVHLFGTIHIGKSSFYPLPSNIINALNHSDALLVELDMTSDKVARDYLQIIFAHSLLPNGETLNHLLSAKDWDTLTSYLESKKTLLPIRPWQALMLLIEKIHTDSMILNGVDLYLINYANENNIPIENLETVDEQLSIFYQLSDQEMAKILSSAIQSLDTVEEDTNRLINAWENGNVNDMDSFITEAKTLFGIQFYDALNIKRNKRFADRIDQALETRQNIFVAIGALHFYDDSVQSYLLKKGYQIKE